MGGGALASAILPVLFGVGASVAADKIFGGDEGFEAPSSSATAQPEKVTAERVDSGSETEKRNRRLRASSLTREFAPPKLGIPALTGT